MRVRLVSLCVSVLCFVTAKPLAAADLNRANSYIAAEFPRVVTAGFEIKRGHFGGGASVGGASFGRELGNGPGESVAVHVHAYPNAQEDLYYGTVIGWQRVNDSFMMRSNAGDSWTYAVVDQPQETSFFVVPHVGYRYVAQENFFVGGEVGWHQPFQTKRDMRSRIESRGNVTANLTDEQRATIDASRDRGLKTKGTLYLTILKAGIVF